MMNRERSLAAVPAAWVAWLAVVAVAIAAETQPAAPTGEAAAGPELDARAAALAGKVLADPLDAAAREKLAGLRRAQERRDAAAYQALAQGLKAYIQAGPDMAAPALRKAAASARAASLTQGLSKPLGKILAELGPSGLPGPEKTGICRKCGGTGRADCTASRCHASGMVPCTKCTGSGIIRVERPFPQPHEYALCPDCVGAGVVPCPVCSGAGTVPCPACKGKAAGDWSGQHLTPEETRRIREVICKAGRLARGEIDLYTSGALKPSPK
jgi:hypothetical protein